MQHLRIGHDAAKSAVTFREMRTCRMTYCDCSAFEGWRIRSSNFRSVSTAFECEDKPDKR